MSRDIPPSPFDPSYINSPIWPLQSPRGINDDFPEVHDIIRSPSMDGFFCTNFNISDQIPDFGHNVDFNDTNDIFSGSLAMPTGHKRTPSSPARVSMHINPVMPPSSLLGLPITSFSQEHNHIRQKSSPQAIQNISVETDSSFKTICGDENVKFNPHRLGFIPLKFWPDRDFSFGELVRDFFQRKNNANSRFSHKLFNALKIAQTDSFYVEFLGVEWITDKVLRVDKRIFARLLGIKTIDGSLFHQQGNFPSHGFVELDTIESSKHVSSEDLKTVDYERVRLFIHQPGVFVRGCDENVIESCKWIPSRKR